jgi:hypothetical protein
MKLSFTTPCRLLPAHLNGWNLFNHFFGKFRGWDSDLRVLVFEMVPQFVILFQRQNVFGGTHAMFLEPFRIDVETARRLVHNLDIEVLPLPRQQPIDKNPRRLGMPRVLDHADNA